jgi:hypothetical protein
MNGTESVGRSLDAGDQTESERTVTLLTAAECRDKAEQKMIEATNAADPHRHHELEATAKAWLELADKIEQAEALEAQESSSRINPQRGHSG